MQPQKVVLITGASRGIGLATAKLFLEKGWIVYAGYRSKGVELVGAIPIRLDVQDFSEIKKAIARISRDEGRLDCLVNNAGFGLIGSCEDLDERALEKEFRTNVLGLIVATKHALPLLRKSRGCVVNISSIAGLMAYPLFSLYNSTKFAVEGFSDSLRNEVRHFGVRVILVEPGPVETDFSRRMAKESKRSLGGKSSPYRRFYERRKQIMALSSKWALPSRDVACKIYEGATCKNPRARYLVAGPFGSLAFLKRFLPTGALDYAISKAFGGGWQDG